MKLRCGRALVVAFLSGPSSFLAAEAAVIDLGGGVRLELVRVKSGTFRQGSPVGEAGRGDDETAREVTLSRDYDVGRYPVTRGQYARFVAETGYRTEAEKGASGGFGFDGRGLVQRKEFTWRNPGFPQTDDHPVVLVTYDDALAFTQWLSGKAGRAITLPTEAQWERACRAGSDARFYRGASDEEARTIAWFKDNAGDGTRPVGQKTPNAFGLYDMSGNAYEWVLDWYGPYGSDPVRDPLESRSTLSDKPRRSLRGGSWLKDARSLRCAARYRNTPGSRNADNGFRVAAIVGGPAPAAAPAAAAPAARTGKSDEAPWWLLGLLAPLAFCGAPLVIVVFVVVRLLRRGTSGVRTRIGDDGFWVYSPDETRGRPISYRVRVDGAYRTGALDSPGSQGEYVYTGGRVEDVKILAIAAAAQSLGQPVASPLDDDPWRRSSDDRRTPPSSSRYPPAY